MPQKKENRSIWNDMRVSKRWQNSHIGVNWRTIYSTKTNHNFRHLQNKQWSRSAVYLTATLFPQLTSIRCHFPSLSSGSPEASSTTSTFIVQQASLALRGTWARVSTSTKPLISGIHKLQSPQALKRLQTTAPTGWMQPHCHRRLLGRGGIKAESEGVSI